MSDLSSYSETLRVARLVPGIPPYCGRAPQKELERKGGKDKPEHSEALPLHLALLLKTPVPREPQLRKARAFLIVMSFFGLRTGIVFYLTTQMFVPWMGGYIFLWRFATKRQQGDATTARDVLPTTRKVHYSGARHPWLNDFFKTASSTAPLFDDVTYEDLNRFISTFVPGVPGAFDVRVYGIRVAADTEAVELDAPKRLVDAVFDWKPVQKRMSSHYSGNNVLLMYKLSHERATNLEIVPIAPGLYATVYRGSERPSWDIPMLPRSAPAIPRPEPATVDAAWNAPAPARRISGRAPRRPTAGGAGEPDRPPSPTLSIDCAECNTHVSRYKLAAMCEVPTCSWGKCVNCFPDRSVELWCPTHRRRPHV
jgi:hypothetical protein